MKAKINSISLPSGIKRGQIDLTEQRKQAGLNNPMTAKEKGLLEVGLKSAIDKAIGAAALLQAHEVALKATLKEIKQARQKLDASSKNDSTKGEAGSGNATL